MTLVLVIERPLSTLEAKQATPLLGKAGVQWAELLERNGLPDRSLWWMSTFYQPKRFRKQWAPTAEDTDVARLRLYADLAEWCAPGQYPCPVVVTLGKRMALELIEGFDLDDDFHVPHKRFDQHFVVFPLSAEAEELARARPSVRVEQGMIRLANFVWGGELASR
jgi:hypothetical protein